MFTIKLNIFKYFIFADNEIFFKYFIIYNQTKYFVSNKNGNLGLWVHVTTAHFVVEMPRGFVEQVCPHTLRILKTGSRFLAQVYCIA